MNNNQSTVKSQYEDDEKLLHGLAEGDMSVLENIYKTYRNDFIRWASQKFYQSGRDELLDIWHDTMIMFYEQVRDRKLTRLTCSLKSFLFLIGYRRLLKTHKRAEKFDLVDEIDANKSVDEGINVLEWNEMEEDKRQKLMHAVDELPEQSRQILVMRFIEGRSVPEIMEVMGYASVGAVSVTLSRTLKRLKDSIVERMATPK